MLYFYPIMRDSNYSVRELSDEAFARVTEVSFPVDKVVECLR